MHVEETVRAPPVQAVIPQTQPVSNTDSHEKEKDILPAQTAVPTPAPVTVTVKEPDVTEEKPCDLPPKYDPPVTISLPEDKCETDEKCEPMETNESKESQPVPINDKIESKPIPFKFPPVSLSKSSNSESKPAVMTVAPLTKPSSSLPTTSTTLVTGTITHGLYTGISIKKSPPSTSPPSSHLMPPRVPPLKLSPTRFSKSESFGRELSSKKSSASKKSKSSKNSIDKLELKVAQLKSASIRCVAPLVISVPQESKIDNRKDNNQKSPLEKKLEEVPPAKEPVVETRIKEPTPEPKTPFDDDKMDLDNDLFEGRLVIAEPDIPSKDDSNTSDSKSTDIPPKNSLKPEDSEDEEIDVVDDGEADSGRGSDISRTEARSLCGDDDIGSPESVPKTPEADRHPIITISNHAFSDSKLSTPKSNGIAPLPIKNSTTLSNGNDCGVLDLSTCGRKRSHDGDMPIHRNKQVANPAVLDKTRQTATPCTSPTHSTFKVLPLEIPHGLYKSKHETSRGNFKVRGNTLTVINPDPNGDRPKIVIRNLGPRLDRGHERIHHHHHNHHHHHQRM